MNTDYYMWCTYLMIEGWAVNQVMRSDKKYWWWTDGGEGYLIEVSKDSALPFIPEELELIAKDRIATV